MNKQILRILIILLIGILSSNQAKAQSPLSGTYTVGSNIGDDFASVSECIDSLELKGVSAAVIIRIDTGTFTEQINIAAIAGLSSTKTLTFVGKGNETVLQYTPTTANRTVVSVNGTSHIIFDSLYEC